MLTLKHLSVATLATLVLSVFGFASSARATLLPYDPNNIIQDAIFLNTGSMSQQDIQNLLTNSGSCLATSDPSLFGPGNTQTAAQLIFQSAQSAGVNPQVILTTLQKEQSLLTKSCAFLDANQGSTYAINHALGYNVPDVLFVGSCLYTFVAQLTGGTCTDSRDSSVNHYRSGPSSMRSSYDNNAVGPGGTSPYPQSFTINQPATINTSGGTMTISPWSKSTALLYRYTPYAYDGNYNFFNIFQTFFGNPTCGTHLSVIQGDASPETAVLFNGTRYTINSLATLAAWGLTCAPTSTIPQATYSAYPYGGQITQVVKSADGPEVYILQGGLRRHIRTSLYVHQLSLDNEPVTTLPAALLANVPEGPPLGFLVQASGTAAIYLSQANGKYYIPNIPTLAAWGFPLSELITVNPVYVNALPTIGNLTTLAKGSGVNIFVAALENLVYAPSVSRLQDWNMQNIPVTILDDSFLQSLPENGSLSRLTRGDGPDTYYIAGNQRWYVQSIKTLNQLVAQYGQTTRMDNTAISSIPYVGVKK